MDDRKKKKERKKERKINIKEKEKIIYKYYHNFFIINFK